MFVNTTDGIIYNCFITSLNTNTKVMQTICNLFSYIISYIRISLTPSTSILNHPSSQLSYFSFYSISVGVKDELLIFSSLSILYSRLYSSRVNTLDTLVTVMPYAHLCIEFGIFIRSSIEVFNSTFKTIMMREQGSFISTSTHSLSAQCNTSSYVT